MTTKDFSIRDYRMEDKPQVINLLRLNTPMFFSAEEESDLNHYLDHERELYYVLETKDLIVGCGGINFAANGSIAKISWDIFHPDYQGRQLGTQLLKHRLTKLKSTSGVEKIMVRTSQMAYGFYEKQGFSLLEIVKNYWAEGFDLYHMEYARSNY